MRHDQPYVIWHPPLGADAVLGAGKSRARSGSARRAVDLFEVLRGREAGEGHVVQALGTEDAVLEGLDLRGVQRFAAAGVGDTVVGFLVLAALVAVHALCKSGGAGGGEDQGGGCECLFHVVSFREKVGGVRPALSAGIR